MSWNMMIGCLITVVHVKIWGVLDILIVSLLNGVKTLPTLPSSKLLRPEDWVRIPKLQGSWGALGLQRGASADSGPRQRSVWRMCWSRSDLQRLQLTTSRTQRICCWGLRARYRSSPSKQRVAAVLAAHKWPRAHWAGVAKNMLDRLNINRAHSVVPWAMKVALGILTSCWFNL